MTTFNLTIDLGNDAMTSEADVAAALLRVAGEIAKEGFYRNSAQWIRDANGNRVGTYKYEDREALRQGRFASK